MDSELMNTWLMCPDVCRCCLMAKGSCNLTDTYLSDSGSKEVYTEMLYECFGISLSNLNNRGCSQQICGLCIAQLRIACALRSQVLQVEANFKQFCSSMKGNLQAIIVKEEERSEITSPGYSSDDQLILNEALNIKASVPDMTNDIAPYTYTNTKRKGVKKKKYLKFTQRERSEVIDNTDSDTPIAELRRLNYDVNKVDGVKAVNELNQKSMETRNLLETNKLTVDKEIIPVLRKKSGKQVSERKRVMLTCGTVLRDTTACPFRHHKSWFQCFFCFKDFMEINPLRDHTLSTHADVDDELKKIKRYPRSLQIDISKLECRHCSLTLTDVNSMHRHFADVHDKVIYVECIADYKVDASPYVCHICKREFHVFRTLTTHLNEHYANCICDVCGKSFLNSKRLKVHKRTHESGIYPCHECGKVLKSKTSKANHIESAHSKRVIKCQICFEPMKHYNDRIKHMSVVHNITHTFKCPICGREYNIKHYLSTHMRQTHGHKNKKCSECGMAFITNHGLKKHMLKHTGEKPFSCTVCCKSYARSYTLREHMRAHDTEKIQLLNDSLAP